MGEQLCQEIDSRIQQYLVAIEDGEGDKENSFRSPLFLTFINVIDIDIANCATSNTGII